MCRFCGLGCGGCSGTGGGGPDLGWHASAGSQRVSVPGAPREACNASQAGEMSVPLAPFLCSEAAATALGCWLCGWAWLKWVHCLWLCVWKRGWVGRGGGLEGMAQRLGAREAAWGSGACRVHPTTPGKKVAKQTNWPAIRYLVTPAGLSVGCSITWPSSRGEMPACAVPPMGAAPPSPLQAAFRAHLSSSSVWGLFQQSSKAWLGSLRPGGKRGD